MISRVFHDWERRLAPAAEHRLVRPFEWGLDWIDGLEPGPADEVERLAAWASRAVEESDAFFSLPPCDDYLLEGDRLSFPSAVTTPHPENNVVRARYFPERSERGRRRAVVVLPQWNADAGGHVGLCQLLNRFGISALRLSLPYHDARMPPELRRADYIVSANVGRTAQVCRQAVLDARRAIAWLAAQGYTSIGILGTSLGSCLSMLTAAHEPLVRAAALNHISPYFADVIWEGLSTAHVREGLNGTDRARCAPAHLDADLAVSVSGTGARQAHAARLRALRPHVSGGALPVARSASSGAAASTTRWRRCRAGTTARASRPFKWMDGLMSRAGS